MQEIQFVYAELVDGIGDAMLQDPQVTIISDGALFMVTTQENSLKYPMEFHSVDAEAREAYNIRFENGILVSSL